MTIDRINKSVHAEFITQSNKILIMHSWYWEIVLSSQRPKTNRFNIDVIHSTHFIFLTLYSNVCTSLSLSLYISIWNFLPAFWWCEFFFLLFWCIYLFRLYIFRSNGLSVATRRHALIGLHVKELLLKKKNEEEWKRRRRANQKRKSNQSIGMFVLSVCLHDFAFCIWYSNKTGCKLYHYQLYMRPFLIQVMSPDSI